MNIIVEQIIFDLLYSYTTNSIRHAKTLIPRSIGKVLIHTNTAIMNGTPQQITAAGRLRQLLSDPSHTVVAPGVYDGISARLALAQGFECLYMV